MFIHSYKYYLLSLKKNPELSLIYKIIIILFGLIFIIIGSSSAYFYYSIKKEEPVIKQRQYLEITSGGFYSVTQSFDEILNVFKIAGAKTYFLDTHKESSQSALGFFVSVDDITKTLSKIELIKNNIDYQKSLLNDNQNLEKYISLNAEISDYYNSAQNLSDRLHNDYLFLKTITIALGPEFYLPKLTNDALWETQDEKKIIEYYLRVKTEANTTLSSLSKLNVPLNFENYYQSQLQYLELMNRHF